MLKKIGRGALAVIIVLGVIFVSVVMIKLIVAILPA